MNSLIYWFLFDPQEDMSHINLLSNKALDLIMAVLEEKKKQKRTAMAIDFDYIFDHSCYFAKFVSTEIQHSNSLKKGSERISPV